MTNFELFSSKLIILPLKDIDTDMIIAARFLKTVVKKGLGEKVFYDLRLQDPDLCKLEGQKILVTGKNFGCGSSREHAVWALKDAGIDVVISSSFADIFKGNAEKNGLLPICLPEEIVQKIIQNFDTLTIDLAEQKVIDPNKESYFFEISRFMKKRFLEGGTDLDYLLELKDEILSFEASQKI